MESPDSFSCSDQFSRHDAEYDDLEVTSIRGSSLHGDADSAERHLCHSFSASLPIAEDRWPSSIRRSRRYDRQRHTVSEKSTTSVDNISQLLNNVDNPSVCDTAQDRQQTILDWSCVGKDRGGVNGSGTQVTCDSEHSRYHHHYNNGDGSSYGHGGADVCDAGAARPYSISCATRVYGSDPYIDEGGGWNRNFEGNRNDVRRRCFFPLDQAGRQYAERQRRCSEEAGNNRNNSHAYPVNLSSRYYDAGRKLRGPSSEFGHCGSEEVKNQAVVYSATADIMDCPERRFHSCSSDSGDVMPDGNQTEQLRHRKPVTDRCSGPAVIDQYCSSGLDDEVEFDTDQEGFSRHQCEGVDSSHDRYESDTSTQVHDCIEMMLTANPNDTSNNGRGKPANLNWASDHDQADWYLMELSRGVHYSSYPGLNNLQSPSTSLHNTVRAIRTTSVGDSEHALASQKNCPPAPRMQRPLSTFANIERDVVFHHISTNSASADFRRFSSIPAFPMSNNDVDIRNGNIQHFRASYKMGKGSSVGDISASAGIDLDEVVMDSTCSSNGNKSMETDSRLRDTCTDLSKPVTAEDVAKMLEDFVKSQTEKQKRHREMRKKVVEAKKGWHDVISLLSTLDSSIRKIPTFIKKIRNFQGGCSLAAGGSIETEMKRYNLSKFVSEVSDAIAEAKLNKMSDIVNMAQLSFQVMTRYADFPGNLWKSLLKKISATFPTAQNSSFLQTGRLPDDQFGDILSACSGIIIAAGSANPLGSSKMRHDARIFAELILSGIFLATNDNANAMSAFIQFIAGTLTVDAQSYEFSQAMCLIALCKAYGDELADLKTRWLRDLPQKCPEAIEMARQKGLNYTDVMRNRTRDTEIVSDDHAYVLRSLFISYYHRMLGRCHKIHTNLRSIQRLNCRVLQTRGEVPTDKQTKENELQEAFDKLREKCSLLGDWLNVPLLSFPETENTCETGKEEIVANNEETSENGEMIEALWGNDENKKFYTEFADLRSLLSNSKEEEQIQATRNRDLEDEALKLNEEDLCIEKVEEELNVAAEKQLETDTEEAAVEDPASNIDDIPMGTSANKLAMELFLSTLTNITNVDLVDKAAHEFCLKLNTKINRRKLVQSLAKVPRQRTDLLPFYARLAASLSTMAPDVGEELGIILMGEFRFHAKKKDQTNLEAKLKTVRFIGEMVKFHLISKANALYCIKTLLADFKHHSIEMCCCILETCGKFLYLSPASHGRTQVYLEIIMRKRNVRAVNEVWYKTMIENAYYHCNPPEQEELASDDRTLSDEQRYVMFLLSRQLSKITTKQVVKTMVSLPWMDSDFFEFAVECFASPQQVRFNSIPYLADVLSGLAKYEVDLSTRVIDEVVERIRFGLSVPSMVKAQSLLCLARYIAELYTFAQIDGTALLNVLTLVIGKHEIAIGDANNDPPASLIRIRMVCYILIPCGKYMDEEDLPGMEKFILMFQQYYWEKRIQDVWKTPAIFPRDLTQQFIDSVVGLKENFTFAQSVEESLVALATGMGKIGVDVTAEIPISESTVQHSDLSRAEEHETLEGNLLIAFTECQVHGHFDSSNDRQLIISKADNAVSQAHHVSQGSAEENESEMNSAASQIQAENHEEDQEEADEIVQMLNSCIAEQYAQRSREAAKAPEIPMSLLRVDNDDKVTTACRSKRIERMRKKGEVVDFILVSRQNNKQQFHRIAVPKSSEFVTTMVAQREAEIAEREELKRRTLNMSEMQEREEMEEYNSTIPKVRNELSYMGGVNRPRNRHGYQHRANGGEYHRSK